MSKTIPLQRTRTLNDLFSSLSIRTSECFATVAASDQRVIDSLSCEQLFDGGVRVATYLRACGLERGNRVMLIAPAGSAWIQSFVGTILAGGVAVPTNHTLTERELLRVLDVARSDHVIVDATSRDRVLSACSTYRIRAPAVHHLDDVGSVSGDRSAVQVVDPADAAVILFTSGTTGRPKGVVRTHREYMTFARWWSEVALSPDDRVANFLPLYHQAGLVVSFLGALARGVPTYHIDRYHPETFWSAIDAHRLTWAVMMQPMPRQLLSAPPSPADRNHSLRWAFGTAGPEDWIQFQERFDVAFHSSYGSTETTIAYMTGGRYDGPLSPERIRAPRGGALCGRQMEGWARIRLATADGAASSEQIGFIEVTGPAVFSDYFEDKARTADVFTSDGWFRTGDYGYVGPSGDLYLLDRADDLIRRSGENIAPREIEEVILGHEEVADCAVIGIPDDVRGEEVAAFVQLRPGATLDAEQIFQRCASLLAGYKVPRYLQYVAEFPRTNTHKIKKSKLALSSTTIDRTNGV